MLCGGSTGTNPAPIDTGPALDRDASILLHCPEWLRMGGALELYVPVPAKCTALHPPLGLPLLLGFFVVVFLLVYIYIFIYF